MFACANRMPAWLNGRATDLVIVGCGSILPPAPFRAIPIWWFVLSRWGIFRPPVFHHKNGNLCLFQHEARHAAQDAAQTAETARPHDDEVDKAAPPHTRRFAHRPSSRSAPRRDLVHKPARREADIALRAFFGPRFGHPRKPLSYQREPPRHTKSRVARSPDARCPKSAAHEARSPHPLRVAGPLPRALHADAEPSKGTKILS